LSEHSTGLISLVASLGSIASGVEIRVAVV